MALVSALKYNGKVYMGFAALPSQLGMKHKNINKDCLSIFKSKDVDHMIIASCGKMSESNVFHFADLVPPEHSLKGDIDFKFMVTEFVPRLFKALDERCLVMHANDDIPVMTSELLVAYKDKLFKIFMDGAVVEFNDAMTIGKGMESAFASLMATKNIDDPEKRILLSLKEGSIESTAVDKPFYIMDTDTCELKVFED